MDTGNIVVHGLAKQTAANYVVLGSIYIRVEIRTTNKHRPVIACISSLYTGITTLSAAHTQEPDVHIASDWCERRD